MARKGNSNDTQRLIHALLDTGIPTLITGPPGVGKTAWVYDLKKQKIHGKPVAMISMVASNRESTDIGGYPTIGEIELSTGKQQCMRFIPTDWALKAADYVAQNYFTIVFVDEYRDITPPVLAALNKCVHENKVGDFEMPKEVRWIAAANSINDSTVGNALPPPTANRFAHVDWEVMSMVGSWCDGMISNTFALQAPLSDEAVKRLGQERALVASFIHKRQELLHVMPKGEDEKDGPWTSPRTLDMSAHAFAAIGPSDIELRQRAMGACVGTYTAAEFIAWQREMDLPDPEKVLDGTIKKWVDLDRPDKTYATLSSVVSTVASKWKGDRYMACWKVMAGAADEGAGDIAAALVPALERTTDGRLSGSVPDPSEHIKSLIPMLERAGVLLR